MNFLLVEWKKMMMNFFIKTEKENVYEYSISLRRKENCMNVLSYNSSSRIMHLPKIFSLKTLLSQIFHW